MGQACLPFTFSIPAAFLAMFHDPIAGPLRRNLQCWAPILQQHPGCKSAWTVTHSDGRTGVFVDPADTVAEIRKWLEGLHKRFAPEWLGKQTLAGMERPAPLIINGFNKV